jgi:hypothetical protein
MVAVVVEVAAVTLAVVEVTVAVTMREQLKSSRE